ncbi:GlsB/YeaQ/YmgE family stress response membrane protein [Sphingomonas sp. FW199]|uniref:GlsB/YeaQ/YmgE family stress response membrane protein n=1 Tax=Sphingomonas sp. FW199 TaxID=3400217 RepID=UPI003CF60792
MPDSFLGWLLIGLVAGAIGKAVMPGRDPGGLIVTILIGIAGALIGGFLARLVGLEATGWFTSYLIAIGGSVLLLWLYRQVVKRRI